MAANWVIDGNNVMGSRPDGWWRDRAGAMQRLVDQIDALVERTGDTATVVFDGPDRALHATRIHVGYAPHADDEIVTRADASSIVVTSDRELVGRVRAKGARVEGARSFLDRL
ncbi:MAG TPA: NYN domain-containing protein [Solirubrobacteraceae bacterium]|nr:NYN domain-containing protein [Solirubrobacteraceae bacterium]